MQTLVNNSLIISNYPNIISLIFNTELFVQGCVSSVKFEENLCAQEIDLSTET